MSDDARVKQLELMEDVRVRLLEARYWGDPFTLRQFAGGPIEDAFDQAISSVEVVMMRLGDNRD